MSNEDSKALTECGKDTHMRRKGAVDIKKRKKSDSGIEYIIYVFCDLPNGLQTDPVIHRRDDKETHDEKVSVDRYNSRLVCRSDYPSMPLSVAARSDLCLSHNELI